MRNFVPILRASSRHEAVLVLLMLSVLVAVTDAAALEATIRRTAHGIPHILANDYAGLGYGYGYAQAEDNLCALAEAYVTADAQRSRYFGPEGTYAVQVNTSVNQNLNSDFFYQQIIDEGRVEALIAEPPPEGLRAEVKELVRGYVAGYNRYLRETSVDHLPDPACRGAAWVHPIGEMSVYRRFYQIAILSGSGLAIDGIGGAQPLLGRLPPLPPLERIADLLGGLLKKLGMGSNAIGLGAEATETGRGMLLGNPHFPWEGSERFYQAQLTIPDRLNASGVSLLGFPLIQIGHTERMAWSHTVSTALRFTLFELTLLPGSATTYLVDGRPEAMKSRIVTVQALRPDGTLEKRSRTLYSTRFGPVVTSILGLQVFPWTPLKAYALADANAANLRYLNHFLETNQAQSTQEAFQVLTRNQGLPWINTVVSDQNGDTLYADLSVVPHVTDAKTRDCSTLLGALTSPLFGLPVLDGSRTACGWGTDADALHPGIFGPSHLPYLFRRDYVSNSNDSYWLANPGAPLTGFARIIGDEETPRSLRTRIGLVMVQDRLAGRDGQPGNRFSSKDLQDLVFSNRQYAGELSRDALVRLCGRLPLGLALSSKVLTPVGTACRVLLKWNLRDDLDSHGALLFRRFWARASAASLGPWARPFDVKDPVRTPNTLATLNPEIQIALGDAVNDLKQAGIPLDASLRPYQYVTRGAERIPLHGGPGELGVFNAIDADWQPPLGYPTVSGGTTYVQVVSFNSGTCPDTATVLAYSQSANPDSPYSADQTRMYADKQWLKEAFCEHEIAADPELQIQSLQE